MNFYDTPRWHRARRKALRRYGPTCMKCGSTHNIEVDHIIARGRGWFGQKYEFSLRNLQILCHDCNQEKGVDFADYRPWYWRLILPIRDVESWGRRHENMRKRLRDAFWR